MTAPRDLGLPSGIGLWSGFLARLSTAEAVVAVRGIEAKGIGTIWLQEFGGVDPFVRAALYLQATDELRVALGVATIHARDAEAMVAAASALEEAFPGRFVLGLGVSHRHLVEDRGHEYRAPIATMRAYVRDMDAVAGTRRLPPRFLGALGPRMVELAASVVDGAHTYFAPVEHTTAVRTLSGEEFWVAPSIMIALGASGTAWRDGVRRYLELCLGMPNYRRNLERYGFADAGLSPANDRLVDALVVPDEPDGIEARLEAQRAAGADHVVVQFIPPPTAATVLDRLGTRLS